MTADINITVDCAASRCNYSVYKHVNNVCTNIPVLYVYMPCVRMISDGGPFLFKLCYFGQGFSVSYSYEKLCW